VKLYYNEMAVMGVPGFPPYYIERSPEKERRPRNEN
jgi:hypothetical protein